MTQKAKEILIRRIRDIFGSNKYGLKALRKELASFEVQMKDERPKMWDVMKVLHEMTDEELYEAYLAIKKVVEEDTLQEKTNESVYGKSSEEK